jgi:hypothetical protein
MADTTAEPNPICFFDMTLGGTYITACYFLFPPLSSRKCIRTREISTLQRNLHVTIARLEMLDTTLSV